MRALILTAIVVFACLSVPGCTGLDEELICEDSVSLTQYEVYECEFSGGIAFSELSIELTSTGDSPVDIFTFGENQYNSWAMCEDFDANDSFSEELSTGASMEGEISYGHFYVVFDDPNSCDEEDSSTPNAEISFKVVTR